MVLFHQYQWSCTHLCALRTQFCFSFLFKKMVYEPSVLPCSYMMSLPKENSMTPKINLRTSAGPITTLCQTLGSPNGFTIFQYPPRIPDSNQTPLGSLWRSRCCMTFPQPGTRLQHQPRKPRLGIPSCTTFHRPSGN